MLFLALPSLHTRVVRRYQALHSIVSHVVFLPRRLLHQQQQQQQRLPEPREFRVPPSICRLLLQVSQLGGKLWRQQPDVFANKPREPERRVSAGGSMLAGGEMLLSLFIQRNLSEKVDLFQPRSALQPHSYSLLGSDTKYCSFYSLHLTLNVLLSSMASEQ